jgi:uncharacterized linocin/CFP29 family protein
MVNIARADDFIGNPSDLTVNSTLTHEAHKAFDNKLLEIFRDRMVGIGDLKSHGLVERFDFGTVLAYYQRIGDTTAASISMDGLAKGQDDSLTYDMVGVPIPVITKDWTLPARQLASSRLSGHPLDTTQMAMSARIVMDYIENMLFNGVPNFVVDNSRIYGYTTHPDRKTVTLSGTGWGSAAGRDILGDTKNMIELLNGDNIYGPLTMYVAKDIWVELQMDYSANKGDKTFKQRIEDFADIQEVKVADSLNDGNVILVKLSSEVVSLYVCRDIINMQWSADDPLSTNFKVMGAMAPCIKSTKIRQCGVCHAIPS